MADQAGEDIDERWTLRAYGSLRQPASNPLRDKRRRGQVRAGDEKAKAEQQKLDPYR